MLRRITRLSAAVIIGLAVLTAEPASPATLGLERAARLYQRTDYGAALEILLALSPKNDEVSLLIGQCYYMSGDAKAASVFLEKAVVAYPRNPRLLMWLGRAYGRRAETANIFLAPSLAVKARRNFEAAVHLDPKNLEAIGDLFEYYLDAPGLLGGGVEKAAELAFRVRFLDLAEYQYQQARLAEKRKQFRIAEFHYRRAADLVPDDPGRLIDLAEFFEARGQRREADEIFRRARTIAPEAPRVWFEQAKTYVRSHRNTEVAKTLLHRYLASNLTPEDPPRYEARDLLRQIPGG